jgi:hypothetical protein
MRDDGRFQRDDCPSAGDRFAHVRRDFDEFFRNALRHADGSNIRPRRRVSGCSGTLPLAKALLTAAPFCRDDPEMLACRSLEGRLD